MEPVVSESCVDSHSIATPPKLVYEMRFGKDDVLGQKYLGL